MIDERTDGKTDEQMVNWTEEGMNKQMNRQTKRQKKRTNGQLQIHKWAGDQTDIWMQRIMDIVAPVVKNHEIEKKAQAS